MPRILETKNLIVKAHDEPHHSRENGGHIVVSPKQAYVQRYDIPLDVATELMHTTMLVGEAATNVLRKTGIDVVRINYQDNGNWAYKDPEPKPGVHIHLYIRTTHECHPANDPRFQTFPDALYFPDRATGYYDQFKPLTSEVCASIKEEAIRLLATDKYEQASLSI